MTSGFLFQQKIFSNISNGYFTTNPIESANSNHPVFLVWDYCSTNKI